MVGVVYQVFANVIIIQKLLNGFNLEKYIAVNKSGCEVVFIIYLVIFYDFIIFDARYFMQKMQKNKTLFDGSVSIPRDFFEISLLVISCLKIPLNHIKY